MPTIVIQDDHIIRATTVLFDPTTPDERRQAFAALGAAFGLASGNVRSRPLGAGRAQTDCAARSRYSSLSLRL